MSGDSSNVSTTIRILVNVASELRAARVTAGLTQAEMGERADVVRPSVTAYESGRREPLFDSALLLLAAAGASVSIETPPAWSWTGGRRPYAVPSRLWRLAPADALGVLEPAVHVWFRQWGADLTATQLLLGPTRRTRGRSVDLAVHHPRPSVR